MVSSASPVLAVNGGSPAVAEDVSFSVWPPVGREEEELVLASLHQDQHAFGPHARQLEKEFAAWNGNRFCTATNSGTAALHMCVAASGVEPGDEIITTALSWTSSASCIIHHQAVPVFVDVDWESMHMDPEAIEAAISPRTRAILVVHYWGAACDMDPIMEIARRHGLFVIEDACQAVGCTYKGRRVGTMGDVGAFSLNQNKNFCGGEGGLFVTDDPDLFRKGKAIGAFSDMRPPHSGREYDDYGLGWMYRTSDLPAAFALAQLRKLPEQNAWARRNWHLLDDLLADTPHFVYPFDGNDRPTNGYAYVLRADPAYARERGVALSDLTDGIIEALEAEGVKMARANWLLPAHAVFQAKQAFGAGVPWVYGRKEVDYSLEQYPVAQDCVDTCLWNINTHRPPNSEREVQALAGAVSKVFTHLDQVPVSGSGGKAVGSF